MGPTQHGSLAAKVVVGLLVFGASLILNGATSLFARAVHRRESRMGLYRIQERLAPASIKIGAVLLAAGLVGGVLLWAR